MTGDIKAEQISVQFPAAAGGAVNAVDEVNITFRSGQITGIIGESGCGKSVLGMAVLGLLPSYAVTSGAIWFRDEDLLHLPQRRMRRLRGREIGLIAQNPADSLNPVRKIGSQLAESIKLQNNSERPPESQALSLLERFGFPKERAARVLDSYPFQLSGGMQQRVAAGMGIASGAKWILADEPSKGLDLKLRQQMYDNLRRLRCEGVEGMIVITHDIELAKNLCDSVAVMYSGQIVEKGAQVIDKPRHPYTKGLLASLPSAGMHAMTGIAPAPGERPAGCQFAPRCPQAQEQCRHCCPGENGDSDEMVRCFLYA